MRWSRRQSNQFNVISMSFTCIKLAASWVKYQACHPFTEWQSSGYHICTHRINIIKQQIQVSPLLALTSHHTHKKWTNRVLTINAFHVWQVNKFYRSKFNVTMSNSFNGAVICNQFYIDDVDIHTWLDSFWPFNVNIYALHTFLSFVPF